MSTRAAPARSAPRSAPSTVNAPARSQQKMRGLVTSKVTSYEVYRLLLRIGTDALNGHAEQFGRLNRALSTHTPVADLGGDIQPGDDFAEDRIFPGPLGHGVRGDEELAPSRIRIAGVGHCQSSGPVEAKAGQKLIWNRDAARMRSGSGRVTRLDHHARNHAMKRNVVIQWTFHHRAGFRVLP